MENKKLSVKEIETLYNDFLEELRPLIAIDTQRLAPTNDAPFGKLTLDALNLLLEKGEALGLKVGNIDNKSAFLEYGSGEKMVAIVCHLDTVPYGDINKWLTQPLELTIKDNSICGRGVVDNKGPLVSGLVILKKLLKEKTLTNKRIRLIFGCAEETTCECLEAYSQKAEMPEYAITPDSEYPVINGEKGLLRASFTKKLSFDYDFELNSGTTINIVPAYAKAKIKEKSYEVFGAAAHASTPELGDNALIKLAKELIKDNANDVLDFILKLNKKDMDIDFSDQYSELTIVPSIAKIDNELATIDCDIRFPVTMKSQQIIEKVEQFAKKYGFDIQFNYMHEPLFFDKNSPFIKGLLKTYQDMTGDLISEPLIVGGGTYAKYLPNTVAFGVSFAGENSNIHKENESWLIPSIKKHLEILYSAIATLDNLDAKS